MSKTTYSIIIFLGIYVAYCSYNPSIENLLGPDINNNGVRDDVDEWISKNIKNKYIKLAYEQIARSHRNRFKNLNNKEKELDAIHIYYISTYCVRNLTSYIDREEHKNRHLLSKLKRPYYKKSKKFWNKFYKKKYTQKEYAEVSRRRYEKTAPIFKELNKKYQPFVDRSNLAYKKRKEVSERFYNLLNSGYKRSIILKEQSKRAIHGGESFVLISEIEKSCFFKVDKNKL